MTRTHARIAVSLVLLWSTVPLLGNLPIEKQRGFNPEQAYQFSGVDSVSLFNGNLSLTLPLMSYPVAADVSYSFVLRYSGNAWNPLWENCQDPGFIGPPPPDCLLTWVPMVGEAGLGWGLSFGAIDRAYNLYQTPDDVESWKYISPDGSEHFFYQTLHEPKCSTAITANCDQVDQGVFYTRDGTYLRLKVSADESVQIVEFPDGQRHRFSNRRLEYIYGASSTLNSSGVPTSNYVYFQYDETGPVPVWTITDSHGREHQAAFQEQAQGRDVIDKLTLSSPEEAPAEYDFTYDGGGAPTNITFPCASNPLIVRSGAVRLLTSLELPHGETWHFKYAPGNQCETAGTLERATLPTGGHINWSYQPYFQSSDGFSTTPGVYERCLRTDANPCSLTVATDKQDQYRRHVPGNDVTVVDTYARTASGTWGRASSVKNYYAGRLGPFAGLPFGAANDGSDVARNISTETYACNPATNVCSSAPERREYVKYEMDAINGPGAGVCNILYPCYRDRNRRMVSARTVHVSDGNKYKDVDYSLFDGLGHYRQTKTTTSFSSSDDVRISYTGFNTTTRDWNPATWTGSDVGTYALTAAGARAPGYTMLSSADSWNLNTFKTSYLEENGEQSRSEACFDPRTGFLYRTRKMIKSDGTANAADLLRVYTRDSASGHPSREESFGGDKQSISTNSLCTMSPPAHNEWSFRIDHTYASGVLVKSKYDGTTFYTVDNLVDSYSGLVSSSSDVSGLSTAYEYDRRGRLTKISPAGLASTAYLYSAASASSHAKVTESTGTGDAKIEKNWEFDPYGRMRKAGVLMPDGTWSYAYSRYDTLGRLESMTEQGQVAENSLPKRSYEYDVFGRPLKVTQPDGSIVTFGYMGERQKTTTRKVSMSTTGADTDVTTTEHYDALGRLVKVVEASGPTTATSPVGADVTTEYVYDEENRLTVVKMKGAGGTVQERLFTYDGRGLLTSESHPESGITSYTYDAAGHVVAKTVGAANSQFDLEHHYDDAARLISVKGRNPSAPTQFRVLKEFEFGAANDGTDLRKGKLVRAARYNYANEWEPVYKIEDRYAYTDTAGRLTERATTITKINGLQSNVLQEIRTAVTMSDLNQLTTIEYPTCIDCGGPAQSLHVLPQYHYKHGRLAYAGAYAGSAANPIEYWPNGLRKRVVHSNGIADSQESDVMSRPSEIAFRTYDRCVKPTFISQPASTAIQPGGSTTLSVSVSGTSPFTYAWKVAGSETILSTEATITVSPSTTTSYVVRVANACGYETSQNAKVSTQGCVDPTTGMIEVVPQPDGSWILRPNPTARPQSRSYLWKRLSDNAEVGTGETLHVAALSATTTYSFTINDECGSATSNVTIAIRLQAPGSAAAQWNGSNGIAVSWAAVAAATDYVVQRRSGTTWEEVAMTQTLSYLDTAVASGRTYAYRVLARGTGLDSAYSVTDVATTAPYPEVNIGDEISTVVFDRMLSAVNSVRIAAGWPAVSWASVLGGEAAAPGLGVEVSARHIATCRARMTEALHALGAAPRGYMDSDPFLKVIKAAHVNEIQEQTR